MRLVYYSIAAKLNLDHRAIQTTYEAINLFN